MTAPTPSPNIALLADQVANQIAAGEVVERPASVVKELVENALDAGAGRVEVQLEDGGRARIRVLDDGCGIHSDQALLAFQRHATSKIRNAADLARVATYGFRGEALASIASVAPVSMRTRVVGEELGTAVVGDGAGGLRAAPVSCAQGTDLEVKQLFASVPARREFLRTAATELGHVIRMLDALALARIDLHLVLIHNGRKVSDYPPAASLADRASSVLGADTAGRLQPVEGHGPYRVTGLLSDPGLSRGTSAGLVLVVDGRPVQDATLVHAVRAAYGSRLPERRYPVGVLSVQCPAATVDVNVHPSKTEVRFLSKQAVHAAVVEAVRAMLDSGAWLQTDDSELPASRKGARPQSRSKAQRRSYLSGLFDPPDADTPRRSARAPGPSPAQRPPAPPSDVPPHSAPARPAAPIAPSPLSRGTGGSGNAEETDELRHAPSAQLMVPDAEGHKLRKARFVGVIADRWLLATADDEWIAIDRQRAAELSRLAAGGGPTQRLMIPVRIGLGEPLVAALAPAMKRLARHGLTLAVGPAGGILARTAPSGLTSETIGELVRAVAGRLLAAGTAATSAEVHAIIDAAMAAAVAPQAGERRSWGEDAALFAALDGVPLTEADGAAVVRSWPIPASLMAPPDGREGAG